ncbi:hypothetical protein VTO42DRAFT_2491 [Malbranchea cinnamomea]
MFWRFGGYQSIPTINTLLDKPDVTVEEVLDEADLLQELKENNTKLIEYLRDDNVLKRLLDYIVSPSLIHDDDEFDDEDGHEKVQGDKAGEGKRSERGDKKSTKTEQFIPAIEHAKRKRKSTDQEGVSLSPDLTPEELEKAEEDRLKYAYIASEILSAPTWSVIEAMMCHETALRDFWHFLWGQAPLDSVQTSYFVKVNEVLLDKKPVEMVSFIMSLEGIVNELLRHVDNPLVMDLLLKVISLDRINGSLGITEWLHSHDLIPKLLAYFSPEHTQSTQTSAGEFLKALITISANAALNEQPCIGPNSLTRQLVSESCTETLIACILQGGNPLTVAVGVVIEIIRKNNPDYDPESVGGRDSPPTVHDPIYLGTLLRLFADHVPQFMEFILSPNRIEVDRGDVKHVERAPLHTSWGENIESLGFDRFKICELMAELLHCSNMGLHNEVGSHELMVHRDAERERLRAQGTLLHQTEDGSSFPFPDASHDDTNNDASGSFFGSGSSEEIRKFEVNGHAGEDDGLEDVSFPGVIVEKPKSGAEGYPEAEKEGVRGSATAPKLGLDDDLVDEPLTPPNPREPVSSVNHREAPTNSQTSQSQHVEPASPTTSLTEEVENFRIESPKPSTAGARGPDSQTPVNSQSPMRAGSEGSQDSSVTDRTWEKQVEEQQKNPTHISADTKTSLTAEVAADLGAYSQYVVRESNGQPVVGDYLKIMFFKHKVIPTIFSFFFRFAWNNFLHHVVYDVVQQVLNGPTEQGFNRALIVDLFESGEITTKIVEGHRHSEEMEKTKKMRMGYMGHLTLIAEEVVRFTDRQPPEDLSPSVMEKVLHPDWVDFVERVLSETRERENAILGGVKPDASMCHRQAVLNAINNNQDFGGSSMLANAGLNGGISNSAFDGFDFMNQGTASSGAFGFSGFGAGSSLLSGFGGSSDDEDDDMEEPEEELSRKEGHQVTDSEGVSSDNANSSDNSANEPIPILSAPPAISSGPSRARRQLAARLAQKEASGATNVGPGDSLQRQQRHSDSNQFTEPDVEYSSPPSYLPPVPEISAGYLSSSSSSDGDGPEVGRPSTRRGVDIDEFDDDMGDMVAPTAGIATAYDDDEDSDDGLITEPLGYSSLLGSSYYPGDPTTSGLHESEDHIDSSDEDEDDGLVEIVVPGKSKLPLSSSSAST